MQVNLSQFLTQALKCKRNAKGISFGTRDGNTVCYLTKTVMMEYCPFAEKIEAKRIRSLDRTSMSACAYFPITSLIANLIRNLPLVCGIKLSGQKKNLLINSIHSIYGASSLYPIETDEGYCYDIIEEYKEHLLSYRTYTVVVIEKAIGLTNISYRRVKDAKDTEVSNR